MKILLVGEYNRSHRFLKDGLIQLGHDAIVVGLKDGFKKVDVDIEIKKALNTNWFLIKLKNALHKFLNIDIHSMYILYQIKRLKKQLSGFDVVQLINETPFQSSAKIEKKIFGIIQNHNKDVYLLSCGDDSISIKYAYDQRPRYSILSPYFENKAPKEYFSYSFKYLKPDYIKLHNYIFKNIKGVIASDLDYHLPLLGHEKYLGMVPNPINIEKFNYQPNKIQDKVIIFHGINDASYYKKGSDIFEEALMIITKKHANKVKIIRVRSLPYAAYIQTFNRAHILLDQTYSYDKGYNALEAMAKGKVVFTGAELEWLEWYNLKEDTVCINALPNAIEIAKKLEWLILNPDKIYEISKNARVFIEREHNYIISAQKYLDKWSC